MDKDLSVGDYIRHIARQECESDDKPICYNQIKVTQLIETLKQLAQINEVDIENFTILKSSYNPEDGSMLFDIKLN